ncbi:MAG: hypothetical protein Q4E09_00160 [Eubacteriales bacterium]|nr:hypothetical protein [Eubacteriales bacterium]
MKDKKVVNSKFNEKAIIISYCPLQNKFEVGDSATKKDPEWIYNIREVFTTPNITKLIINFTKNLEEYRTSKGGVNLAKRSRTKSQKISVHCPI